MIRTNAVDYRPNRAAGCSRGVSEFTCDLRCFLEEQRPDQAYIRVDQEDTVPL